MVKRTDSYDYHYNDKAWLMLINHGLFFSLRIPYRNKKHTIRAGNINKLYANELLT